MRLSTSNHCNPGNSSSEAIGPMSTNLDEEMFVAHTKLSTVRGKSACEPKSKKRRTAAFEESPRPLCDVAALLRSLRTSGAAPEKRVLEVTGISKVQFEDDLNSLPLDAPSAGPSSNSSQDKASAVVAKPCLSAVEWALVRNTMMKQQAMFSEQLAKLHLLVETQKSLASQDLVPAPEGITVKVLLPLSKSTAESINKASAAGGDYKSPKCLKPAAVKAAVKTPECGTKGADNTIHLSSSNSSTACSVSCASGEDGTSRHWDTTSHTKALPGKVPGKVHLPQHSPSDKSKSQVVNSSPPAEVNAAMSKRKSCADPRWREEGTGEVNKGAGKGAKGGVKHKAVKDAKDGRRVQVKAPHWSRGYKVVPCAQLAIPTDTSTKSMNPTKPLASSPHVPPSPLPGQQSESATWQPRAPSTPNGLPVSPFWDYYAAFAAGYSASAQRLGTHSAAPPAMESSPAMHQGFIKQMPFGYNGFEFQGANTEAPTSLYSYPSGMGGSAFHGMGASGFQGASASGGNNVYLGSAQNYSHVGGNVGNAAGTWPFSGMQGMSAVNRSAPRSLAMPQQHSNTVLCDDQGALSSFKTPPPLKLYHDASSRQQLVSADAMQ